MKKIIAITLVLILSAGSGIAFAAPQGSCGVCNIAESRNWAVSAPGKLTRGITNIGLSWAEIFVQPFKEPDVVSGIGKGFGYFFLRLFQGAGEVILFWLPPSPTEPVSQCTLGDFGWTGR